MRGLNLRKHELQARASRGDGIKFSDPDNTHNYYRFMNDSPRNQNPLQQNIRIEIKIDGHNYDAFGNQLPNQKHIDSHIQIDKSPYIFIRKPFN